MTYKKCSACGAYNKENDDSCVNCVHSLKYPVGDEKCACAHCREARKEKTKKVTLEDGDEVTLTTCTINGKSLSHLTTG